MGASFGYGAWEMIRFLLGIVVILAVNGYALWYLAQNFLAGDLTVTGDPEWLSYAVVAAVFTVVNTLVRPVVMLISLPVRWLTMGLATVALNGVLMWVTERGVNTLQLAGTTVTVNGLLTYVLVGIALGSLNAVLHWVLD